VEPKLSTSKKGTEGAVFVEFLIAFLPVFTMFLCMVQLGLLFAVRLVVEHAAVNCARSAAVIIADEPGPYQGGSVEAVHSVLPSPKGARFKAIERVALLTLAPFIIDGTIRKIDIQFPKSESPGGAAQEKPHWNPIKEGTIEKMRVHLRAEAVCKIALANRIMCKKSLWRTGIFSGKPGKEMNAEAIFPYQGASYKYK
jgi:hypothetical protein